MRGSRDVCDILLQVRNVIVGQGSRRHDMQRRQSSCVAIRTANHVIELIDGLRALERALNCRRPGVEALDCVRAQETANAGSSGGLIPETVTQAVVLAEDRRKIGVLRGMDRDGPRLRGHDRMYIEPSWMSHLRDSLMLLSCLLASLFVAVASPGLIGKAMD